METASTLHLKERLKNTLTPAEAEELGRQVYTAVMWNDNAVAIVSLRDHKRAIGVYAIDGEHNFSLVRPLCFQLAGEVERELRMKAREDQSK